MASSLSSINTSSPTHLALYLFLFLITTAKTVLTCLEQPLFPFQPESLEWNHAWLTAIVIDYYGACLCLCGIVLASEQNLLMGTLWSVGCCLLGSPVCCMWILLHLHRFGVMGLSLQNVNTKDRKSDIRSKSQDYDNEGDIEMDDDLKALNELNIDDDLNLHSDDEEEEEEEDGVHLLEHNDGEQSQQQGILSWRQGQGVAWKAIAGRAHEAGDAMSNAMAAIWDKERGSEELNDETTKEQVVDQPKRASSRSSSRSLASSVTEGAAVAAGVISQSMSAIRERGEKIERMDNKAAELESEASNYADLAKKLKEKNKENASGSGGFFSRMRNRSKTKEELTSDT